MNTKNTMITVLTLLCMTTAVYAQSAKADDAAKSTEKAPAFMGGPEMKGTEKYFAQHEHLFPEGRGTSPKKHYKEQNDAQAKKAHAARLKEGRTSAPFLDAQEPPSLIVALIKSGKERKKLSAAREELNDAIGVKESFSSRICKDCGYENAPFFAVLGKYFEEHKKAKAEEKKAAKETSAVSPEAKAFFDAAFETRAYEKIASVIVQKDCGAKPVTIVCGGKNYTYDGKITDADIAYIVKYVKDNIITHSACIDVIYKAIPPSLAESLKNYAGAKGVLSH